MSALFKNNATALLAASISTSGTTLVLAAGTGIKFPVLTGSDFFYGTIYDAAGNYEIVKVTARSADSLTVVRAQEGTVALAFSSGDAFAQRVTAATLNDFVQKSSDQTLTGVNTFEGNTVFSAPVSGTSATFSGAISSVDPTFTGTVTVPTKTAGDNTTCAASTEFVTGAINTGLGTLGTMSTQNANAVNITGGSIAGISDLAVADGGTGVSTLTANAVVLGNGTSPVQTVAPGTSGNALVSNGTTWVSGTATPRGLGFSGETWQSTSFSIGSTYTNNKSYPVMVSTSILGSSSGGYATYVSVGGVQITYANYGGATGTWTWPVSFIVPPGVSYSFSGRGVDGGAILQ